MLLGCTSKGSMKSWIWWDHDFDPLLRKDFDSNKQTVLISLSVPEHKFVACFLLRNHSL